MNLNSIPAFQDNYIWVLSDDEGNCIIVDPGEATPVLETIKRNNWKPEAILLTHHHHDHVGGVKELTEHFPGLVVYGPQETLHKGANRIVAGGDSVNILKYEFSVIATPGHTSGHLSYFSFPYLFCGDTLFSGGCGRLFEGSPQQMHQSLQLLNKLPADTLVCCAHEYTLANLTFAKSVLPEDPDIEQYYRKVKELRAKNQSTLPVNLATERKINLFLRTDDIELQKKIGLNPTMQQDWQVFARLREKKDHF